MAINLDARFIDALDIANGMYLRTTIATEISILPQSLSNLSDFKLLSLYNFASGKDWKQAVGCLTDIEGEDMRKFITAACVSLQKSRGLLFVYTQSSARFYPFLELQKRADRQSISINFLIEICKHLERFCDLP